MWPVPGDDDCRERALDDAVTLMPRNGAHGDAVAILPSNGDEGAGEDREALRRPVAWPLLWATTAVANEHLMMP